ncbi:MAG TPA: hypothetical protein VFX56_06810 [Nitrospira sp.]|nr:hypothetical protein [Nitrospira sp.]
MAPMHDPAKIAAQYRAVQLADGVELRSGSTKLVLKRGGAFVHLSTAPTAVRWHANENEEPFHVVHLAVTEFSIGHRGDEGWSSNLADDCIFVIDGEALRHVPVAELRVLSEERFNVRKAWLAAERGDKSPPNTSEEKRPLAVGTVVHCPASPELGIAECLDCTLGIPQSHFDKLVQGCLTGRISSAHFHGITGGLSSSFEYGALRDLLIISGGELNLKLDSLSFEYRA